MLTKTDANNKPVTLKGPHIAVQDIVPLIPATASRPVTVQGKVYRTFTLAVRVSKVSGICSLLASAPGLPPAITGNSSLPIKTIGEACRQQAQALIEKAFLFFHQRLEQGEPAQNILAHLFAKQQAPVVA